MDRYLIEIKSDKNNFFDYLGLKKAIEEEKDAMISSQCTDPIVLLPKKIDQLLNAINRVGFEFYYILWIFMLFGISSFTWHRVLIDQE